MRQGCLILVGLAVLVAGSGGCDGVPDLSGLSGWSGLSGAIYVSSKDFNISQTFDGVTSLEIDWREGNVTVTVDPAAAGITASGSQFAVAGSLDEANAQRDKIEISLSVSGSDATKMTLDFNAPSGTGIYGADLTVKIPVGVGLEISSANGDVTVTGNSGATSVSLTKGSVMITDQVGNVTVETTGGAVQVASQSGSVEVQTDAGDITIEAEPSAGGVVDAQTQLGDVTLDLLAGFGGSLELSTRRGAVNARLTDFTISGLITSPKEVTGVLNGGGGKIVARTDIGDINFDSL